MEGALPVSEISDDRNARLLVESSHARPPSSKTSFQRTLLNFTASTVFLLSSANTVEAVKFNKDRKSTRLNSSHEWTSYAVFCSKKKIKRQPPPRKTVLRKICSINQ